MVHARYSLRYAESIESNDSSITSIAIKYNYSILITSTAIKYRSI